MVEVDVGEHEVMKILERKAVAREASFKGIEASRRTAVHQSRLRIRKQVRRDDPGPPEMEEVEKLEAT
jgi:hypothetical protein